MPSPTFFLSPKPRDPRLGAGGGGVSDDRRPNLLAPGGARGDPAREAGGKPAGAPSSAPRSPARRSGHPPSLAAPFPLGAGRKRLPPASPNCPRPETGPPGARKREPGRRGGSGGQEAGGEGRRGGVPRLHESRGPLERPHTPGRRGEGKGRVTFKVRGELGVYRGPRC